MNRKQKVKSYIAKNNQSGLIPNAQDICDGVGINRNYVYDALEDLVEEGFLIRGEHRSYLLSKTYTSPETIFEMKKIVSQAFGMCRCPQHL